jgi:hypothetical protein
MRRLALAVMGVQLVGLPMAHADGSATPGGSDDGAVAVAAAWAPSTGLSGHQPERQLVNKGSLGDAAPPSPTPLSPASPSPTVGQRLPGPLDLQPHWQPPPPVASPGPVMSTPLRAAREPQTGHELVVRSGDSLWTIAARHLGPEASDVDIALEWPRWFESNKGIIGSNPDLLLPGQTLRAP